MRVIEIPEAWRRRSLVIEGPDVDESWFADEEIDEARSFAREKRRFEWLLSRYAAKKLALERGLVADPRLFDLRSATIFRSLSHSGPYAAAALDDAPVGVDIQVVREVSEKASHLFLKPEEERAMLDVPIENRLIHFWAAKEAAWKRLGGRVTTLKRVSLRLGGVTESGLKFDGVETVRIGDVVIALTL